MSKKRISAHAAEDVAKKRISVLMGLSVTAVRDGNEDRAKRYVSLAKRIGQKTKTAMPEDSVLCKNCDLPLIPGLNCRTRVGDHKVKITCLGCGRIIRMPYVKEQRE